MRKDEIVGKVVNRYVDIGGCHSSIYHQQRLCPIDKNVLRGKHACFYGGEQNKVLLEESHNEEYASNDKQGNCATIIPTPS